MKAAFPLQDRMGFYCSPPQAACRIRGAGSQKIRDRLKCCYQYINSISRHWPTVFIDLRPMPAVRFGILAAAMQPDAFPPLAASSSTI